MWGLSLQHFPSEANLFGRCHNHCVFNFLQKRGNAIGHEVIGRLGDREWICKGQWPEPAWVVHGDGDRHGSVGARQRCCFKALERGKLKTQGT